MLHATDLIQPEREKYEAAWSIDEYKNYSPGEVNVERFMKVMEPAPCTTLIDIGCGAGVAGLAFAKHSMIVSYLDLVGSALKPEVPREKFIEAAVWSPTWHLNNRMGWDYGFCCDVLEHIPPELTMLVVDRILQACRDVWLQIALRPDAFGKLIGQPLHLTVQPFAWWRDRLSLLGHMVEARDLCGDGLFIMRGRR